MHFHMRLKTAAVRCRVWTPVHCTLVRFLTCVYSHVRLQVTLIGCCIAANGALVRLLAAVGSLVRVQTPAVRSGIGAKTTLVFFFAGVYARVAAQVFTSLACVGTVAAFVSE